MRSKKSQLRRLIKSNKVKSVLEPVAQHQKEQEKKHEVSIEDYEKEVVKRLDEKRRNDLKVASGKMKFKLLRQGRCPFWTLVPPWKHFEKPSDIPIKELKKELSSSPSIRKSRSPDRNADNSIMNNFNSVVTEDKQKRTNFNRTAVRIRKERSNMRGGQSIQNQLGISDSQRSNGKLPIIAASKSNSSYFN